MKTATIAYHQRMILAAMRTVRLDDLIPDPQEKEALVREVLDSILSAGFLVCKPQTLELDIPAQIAGCLRVAHRASALGDQVMTAQKIEAALASLQLLGDYLRELGRLGTVVPITWKEFVSGRYARNTLTGGSERETDQEIADGT